MRPLAALSVALSLATSGAGVAASVDARDYDAFWLWAGVKPQPVLAQAKVIYLLQGEVTASTPPRLVSQIGATPAVRRGQLWIVYRVQTLDWTPPIYAEVIAHLRRWRDAGNPVVGVQIDFDARTHRLAAYAAFLKDLRARLPADCRLGVTGLMDWSSGADPAGLTALDGVVDELIVQTYQGRRTIPGYGAYLARLSRLGIAYRIGLIQGGDWTPPPTLANDPNFRGYVVFLRNPRAAPAP